MNLMRLLFTILLLGTAAGCNRHEPSTNQTDIVVDQSATPESAFEVGVSVRKQSPSDRSPAASIPQNLSLDDRLKEWRIARKSAKHPIDPNNLDAIERAIKVEPEYKGDERHYYCLLFDDDQTQTMWMVFDGSMLYVDRNFNSDLTDEDEAFPTSKNDTKSMLRSVGKINFKTGSGQKAALEYTFPGFRIPGSDPNEYPVRIQVTYRGATFSAWGDQTGEVANAKSPSDATILRINGPLQMGFEVSANHAVQRTENGDFKVNAGDGTYG